MSVAIWLGRGEETGTGDLLRPTNEQIEPLRQYIPEARQLQADDRRTPGGIVFFNRYERRWRDGASGRSSHTRRITAGSIQARRALFDGVPHDIAPAGKSGDPGRVIAAAPTAA